ncbi:YbgC/FadM family acyl-CoA thioesterase [Rhodoplanes sp. TEM]|uniref:YbgC/FadM family acyl-CoA thioesterase n=1 Tax=Rhodoplanes tepidamans TaxID=200616 RepID=A0ABT5JB49_RHOTP|nr:MULTISPECIES: YbgC/FadM family acyl-CoA thioesterase [Rhodoplanes]MDC7786822.1 YbgC/FadM family acyl-CoA thioesterase [Rhodoplanes tepidamans]MDC7985978.1 YbgC/FadM family acyl-CoA thioesterase [Rhodoplanes sp. TEM]MDQ0355950.1 acyl-CoA thioester hydrolase [Rhodoplanes tepidamans]
MAVRIHREDTDFSGIVYHASYVRFLERGRTNYLRLLGTSQGRLWDVGEDSGAGLAFVVRAMTLDFLRSARLDDLLTVLTASAEVKGASAILAQSIVCGDTRMLEARVRIALVSEGRARPFPRPLRAAMRPPDPAA